jgi:hypothetical protein
MTNRNIHKAYISSFRWTLSGSFVYEACKVTHCIMLMQCMPTALYGTMGSIFSIIYLVTYIADLGATNSLPPFIQLITKSKYNFKTFIIKYCLVPHSPIIIACATGARYVAMNKFSNLPDLWLIPCIICLETIRTFLRMLLHATFLSKYVVSIELTILAGYLAITWTPVILLDLPVTLNTIFIPHLIDSAVCVTAFLVLLIKYYRNLPDGKLSLDSSLSKRLVKTRTFNYLLRVTRNMFTSNFLTPLFAWRFGLVSAGTFYIASIIVNALQSVIKSTVWYPGSALLANVKEASQETKLQAFANINSKLTNLLAPIIIIIALNINGIIKMGMMPSITSESIALALLFLLISFAEFFFLLYEQLYIIEEAANKLFLFKVIELLALYLLIRHNIVYSPATTLVSLIVVRALSFSIIAVNAWNTWKASLRFYTSRWVVGISIVLGIVLSLISKYII